MRKNAFFIDDINTDIIKSLQTNCPMSTERIDPTDSQVKISRFLDISEYIVRDHDNEKSGINGLRPDVCIGSSQRYFLQRLGGRRLYPPGFGLGTDSAGPAMTGGWTHNDDDGDAASPGLGFNVPLGPFTATVGGKGIYTNPNDGDEGYAAAVGGGLQWKIGDSFGLFGEYYYSPDSLSSGIDSYEEANVGGRWTIIRPVTIEAGYRYLNPAGKDGHRDNALADGPYIGVSAGF